MSNNNKFVEFIENEQSNCEKYLRDSNAYSQAPIKVESKHVQCYDNLAIIYRYRNDINKSNKMFYCLTTINQYPTRYAGLSEDGKKKMKLLVSIGSWQMKNGIYFNLAHEDPQKANQLFEWAAENCYQSEEVITVRLKYHLYDEIAVGFVWRGYALLNLGNYDEAFKLLTQVVPYLNKQKKKGIEMWRKVEYALPKALVPLCEYKLDPTQENLQKAQVGVEDYIKSLRENKDKLEGYLYYFQLKEVFSDVYNAEVPEQTTKAVHREESSKKIELPPGEYDSAGSVIVFDMESGSLEVFGTQNELEEYVKKLEHLGDYPVLSGMMELYVTDAQQEPEPLIEECKRLLSYSDADHDIKEKTGYILNVAQDAKNEESTVMLYFDPEV